MADTQTLCTAGPNERDQAILILLGARAAICYLRRPRGGTASDTDHATHALSSLAIKTNTGSITLMTCPPVNRKEPQPRQAYKRSSGLRGGMTWIDADPGLQSRNLVGRGCNTARRNNFVGDKGWGGEVMVAEAEWQGVGLFDTL